MLNIKRTPATIAIANKQNLAKVEIAKIDLDYLKKERDAYIVRESSMFDKAVELGYAYDYDEAVELACEAVGGIDYEDFDDAVERILFAKKQATDIVENSREFLADDSATLELMQEQARIAEEAYTIAKEMLDALTDIGSCRLLCYYMELVMADEAEDVEEDAEKLREDIIDNLKCYLHF